MGWSEGKQTTTKFNITITGIMTTFNILTQWGQIPKPDLKIICEKWGENGANNNTRVA